LFCCCFFFQAEDGIRDFHVTGVQTCALPISHTSISSSPAPMKGRMMLAYEFQAACGQVSSPRARAAIMMFCMKAPQSSSAPCPKIGRASCRERGYVAVARAYLLLGKLPG